MNLMLVNQTLLEVKYITGSATLAPIVFLHEGLGSVSLWKQRGNDWPEAVCTATGRAGLVYSRRGYGQSAAAAPLSASNGHPALLPADYMHQEARVVLPALLRHLKLHLQSQFKSHRESVQPDFDKPVLLGHSDGATIALLYASALPVSACIAMAPHVVVEPVAIRAISAAKTAFESGGLRAGLARHHADPEGAFWQWNDVWLSPAFKSFDIRADCKAITAPLLLIQGLQDEYGSLLQLDAIANAAPHARQLRLVDCGHSPHRDHAALTAAAVVNFLAKLD